MIGFTRALKASAAALAVLAAPMAASAACQLTELDRLPLDPGFPVPVVDGELNGHEAKLLAATGFPDLAVFRGALPNLGVREFGADGGRNWVHDTQTGERIYTGSSYLQRIRVAGLDTRDLGRFFVRPNNLYAQVLDQRFAGGRDYAGALGWGFWQASDDEFDMANHAIRLIDAKGCGRGDTLPWNGGRYSEVGMVQGLGRYFVVPVTINGVRLNALLDTSSPSTVITWNGAHRLHIAWPAPRNERYNPPALVHVSSFQIGQESVSDPRFVAQDVDGGLRRIYRISAGGRSYDMHLPDVILGADFFRTHKVLISDARQKVYFAPVAGGGFGQEAPEPPS